MEQVTIGITDCARYPSYANWLLAEPGVQVIQLAYDKNNSADIEACDGILLTGGQDVHPRYYNKPGYMDYYKDKVPDIDENRDSFELATLTLAQERKLPVLGICRGLQIANVFFGGSLVLDIPTSGGQNHSKIREGEDRYHTIEATNGTALQQIAGALSGIVNSAHHQSALQVADALVVAAVAEDGVVEALERKNFFEHPYLLLVQWHPERMTDQLSPFSLNLKTSFLAAARQVLPTA